MFAFDWVCLTGEKSYEEKSSDKATPRGVGRSTEEENSRLRKRLNAADRFVSSVSVAIYALNFRKPPIRHLLIKSQSLDFKQFNPVPIDCLLNGFKPNLLDPIKLRLSSKNFHKGNTCTEQSTRYSCTHVPYSPKTVKVV